MALCHETMPEMYGTPGFEFEDPVMVPFQNSLNSPLAFGWPTFASCAGSLYLHPGTAMMLDDVRTMFQAVASLPEEGATEAQIAQVLAVAQWVYTRLGELPDNVLMRSSRPLVSSASSGTASPPSSSPQDKSSPDSASGGGGGSSSSRQQTSPAKTETIDRTPPPSEFPDPVYRMVRMTAVIYCRAILSRVPTSMVCSDNEFIQIWLLTWRVPMASRRSIVGIFTWVLLVIAPSCHNKAPARFIKTMAVNALMTVAVENWHLSLQMADTALRVQRFLNGDAKDRKGTISGSESIIDKYGFAQKEVLKNISKIHLGDDDDEADGNDDAGEGLGGDEDEESDYKGGYVDEMDEDESYKEDLMAK